MSKGYKVRRGSIAVRRVDLTLGGQLGLRLTKPAVAYRGEYGSIGAFASRGEARGFETTIDFAKRDEALSIISQREADAVLRREREERLNHAQL